MKKHRLSTQQRRYYFGEIVSSALAYYKEHEMDLVRDILAGMKYSFTPEFVHELIKMIDNNGRSTGDLILPPEQFLTKVRARYARNYGLDIPPPNEPPIEQLTTRESNNV